MKLWRETELALLSARNSDAAVSRSSSALRRSLNCQQSSPGRRWLGSGAFVPRRPDKAAFVRGGLERSCLGGAVELNGHFVVTAIAASVRFHHPSVLQMIPSAGLIPCWLCRAPRGWGDG